MLAVNCARWEHLLADPGCSGWERLVCGQVRETAGARSPGRIDGGTVVDLQEDCGLPKLKTDAPILIDASQKIDDPGLCRDPFQIDKRSVSPSGAARTTSPRRLFRWRLDGSRPRRTDLSAQTTIDSIGAQGCRYRGDFGLHLLTLRISAYDRPGRLSKRHYSLATPNGVKVTIMLEELLASGFETKTQDKIEARG